MSSEEMPTEMEILILQGKVYIKNKPEGLNVTILNADANGTGYSTDGDNYFPIGQAHNVLLKDFTEV